MSAKTQRMKRISDLIERVEASTMLIENDKKRVVTYLSSSFVELDKGNSKLTVSDLLGAIETLVPDDRI